MIEGLVRRAGRSLRQTPRTVPPLHPADADPLRRTLAERGWLVLPGLIGAAEVQALRSDLAGVFRLHGWLAEETGRDLVPNALRRDGVPGWWRFAEDVQRCESFHRLAHHPALTGHLESLVQSPLLNHPRRHLVVVHPEFWVPPYQDFTHIQGTPDFLTAYVALADDEGEASLSLLSGPPSQEGVRELHVLPTKGVAAHTQADDSWTDVSLSAGDVVVAHALTVRRFNRNRGREVTLFPQYRYQSADLPVVKASLKPEHYPRLPDWAQLVQGWGSSRWVAPPLAPRLVPYVMPHRLEEWHTVVAADHPQLRRQGRPERERRGQPDPEDAGHGATMIIDDEEAR